MPKFLRSATNVQSILINDDVIEFCFIGRSNVGKSTLINALANAKIAKTSKTPGLTKLINVFDFGDYRIVDLPGYGYAKISKQKKFEINNMLNDYINNRSNLFCVFQICDIQNITDLDVVVHKDVCRRFKNAFILLNKVDKTNKSFFDNNKNKIAKQFHTNTKNLIPISGFKKQNIVFLKKLMNALAKKVK